MAGADLEGGFLGLQPLQMVRDTVLLMCLAMEMIMIYIAKRLVVVVLNKL